jgi:hypothetical protein
MLALLGYFNRYRLRRYCRKQYGIDRENADLLHEVYWLLKSDPTFSTYCGPYPRINVHMVYSIWVCSLFINRVYLAEALRALNGSLDPAGAMRAFYLTAKSLNVTMLSFLRQGTVGDLTAINQHVVHRFATVMFLHVGELSFKNYLEQAQFALKCKA